MTSFQHFYDDLYASSAPPNKEVLDLLCYEINQRIYYFGDHFRYPRTTFPTPYSFLKDEALLFIINLLKRQSAKKENRPTYFTSAYFQFENKLPENLFFKKNPWATSPLKITDKSIYLRCKKFDMEMRKASFAELLSDNFSKKIQAIKKELKKYYISNNIQAAFFSNDMTFWDRLGIKICKELDCPSFIFLHGLPARYNHLDDNRSDYLIVWGEQIKRNYIAAGFSPSKILVAGHPTYDKLPPKQELKSTLDDIMVITHSLSGAPHSIGKVFADRGNLITYLRKIQAVLESLGVKKARLRPHPCENPNWYSNFLGSSFFEIEKGSLAASIEKSTLLLGAPSTLLLESLYRGVNYIIFDPAIQGENLIGAKQVPPFDGSDKRIIVTRTEEELLNALSNPHRIDHESFIADYIKAPFELPERFRQILNY